MWVRDWTQHGDERWPNNDGIDIDSSSDVLLERSAIDTADDGVCIKGSTFPLGRVHNVTVRDCTVRWAPNVPASYGPALRTVRVAGLRNDGFRGEPARAPARK